MCLSDIPPLGNNGIDICFVFTIQNSIIACMYNSYLKLYGIKAT